NPKMRRFIYGERGGVYIIDLLKTSALLAQAQQFAGDVAHRGGTVLFVGTKKQARDTIRDVAEAADMPYVNHRWLGGLLTNFQTINQRIRRLHDLERYEADGQLELLPTRERMSAQADLEKLRANLGGVKNMQRVPDAMFVIDLRTEVLAVREAQRLRAALGRRRAGGRAATARRGCSCAGAPGPRAAGARSGAARARARARASRSRARAGAARS